MIKYKRYLSDEIVDVIHEHFPKEGYPVQNHEDGFKAAVKLLKNPSEENLEKAKFEITRSVLAEVTPDSPNRPTWKDASEKASTIIEQIRTLPAKALKLEKVI